MSEARKFSKKKKQKPFYGKWAPSGWQAWEKKHVPQDLTPDESKTAWWKKKKGR
jgi:hypothetical protein